MASPPSLKTVTYEEWLRLPEVTDEIEEVVNGEIRLSPPHKWKHSQIVSRVYDQIRPQVDDRKVMVISASFGLIIRRDPLTSRIPDLAVFELSTMVEQDGYVHSAPQLVVEVLSPSNTRHEREEKLGDYAALGVPEVWVVSPEARTVEVLYLENGYLRGSAPILAVGLLKPRRFPGVQVDISGIWPD